MLLCSSAAFTYRINNNILAQVNSFKDITYFDQADLNALVKWYNEWQFIVNIVKSIFMPLCSSAAFTYRINNNILAQVNSFKDLDIVKYFDSCCFKANIVNIVKHTKYLSH